ncbi:MAG TPA: hypothetical protein VI959_04530, partial [Alphaproteobacteria bacterium]|nr:hypothetical protein [Alphaproteobacteria bacterium]
MSSGLSAALGTFVLGVDGYSQRFNGHSQNTANAGVPTAKKHEMYLYSMVTQTSSTDFSPGGINATPVAYIGKLGSIRPSVYPTFLALHNSNAFFVVNENTAGTGNFSVTRLGTFKADANGFLKNSAGKFLYGISTDTSGKEELSTISNFSQMKAINTKNLSSSAVPTSGIDYSVNFPGNAEFYATDGTEYTIQASVFDSLGIN